ncbi:MAG: heme biosynthesis HemY N-terminal domain-containing protein [Sulfuriferula sp.]|nr:heme biosynthesis HemY N-terminal domain-containing protein [Sulfuriferula sp.]
MRILIWILLIFALAVGFTLAGKFDPGYAVLVYPPYRIELSLTLLVVLFLGLLVLGDMFARLANATLSLPQQVRAFRRQQRQHKEQAALLAAMSEYLEQRYPQAESAAQHAIELNASVHLAALIAARAAEAQQAHDRRDKYLAIAARHSAGVKK